MQLIEVTGFGVRSAVIRLRHRDTPLRFVIYPMIHTGERSYYTQVEERLRKADVIVAEGVRPGASRRPSALATALTLSYSITKHNRRADLVTQDIDIAALGVPVLNPDVDMDEFRSAWRRIPRTHRLIVWCVLPGIILGRLFGRAEAMWSTALEVDDLPSDEDEDFAADLPEMHDAFAGERDARLIAALCHLHEERASEAIEVAVVYGALHVPPVLNALKDRYGYIAGSGEWLTVVDLVGAPDPPAPPAKLAESVARAKLAVRAKAADGAADGAGAGLPAEREEAAPAGTVPTAAGDVPVDGAPAGGAPEALEPAVPDLLPARARNAAAKVARLRGLAERRPVSFRARLADALAEFSDRLADAGLPEEGLEAADEAVDIAEELRELFGAGHDLRYARAAYALARRLWEVGRTDDGDALYAEAAEVYRTAFRDDDPDQRAGAGAPGGAPGEVSGGACATGQPQPMSP